MSVTAFIGNLCSAISHYFFFSFLILAVQKNIAMKKTSTLAFGLLICAVLFAQSPQGMNYQAVVRNSSGVIANAGTPVLFRFTIHDLTPSGTSVFTETQTDTTNQFGLVTAVIGSNGNLSTINWGNGEKYLQVEMDVDNSGSYTDMGTTQLMSVPYALYAANSNAGPAGPTGAQGPQGPQGFNGATGAQGVTGPQGDTGPQGVQGATGATGPQGDTGPQGTAGLNGNDGVTGLQGIQGATGPQGDTGPQGAAGATGNDGATGPQGIQGVNGPEGPTGPQGIAGTNASLPSGMIVMWSGTLANIPSGWVLCDGSNGTPNLLDRFIVSVPNNGTNPGATGGANTYSLSVAQLPSHNHTGSGTTSADGSHTHTLPGYHLTGQAGGPLPWYNWANSSYAVNTNTTSADGQHTHSYSFTTSATGSGAAVDNRPAYYALAFIMKL